MISCTERILRRIFLRPSAEEKAADMEETRKVLEQAKADLELSSKKLRASTARVKIEGRQTKQHLIRAIQELSAGTGR